MTSRLGAHAELKRVFDFPDWCGPNWDAFNDCFGGYVHEHDGERIAVVWNDFEVSAAAAPATTAEVAWALLECAEGAMPSLNPSVKWSVDLDLFVLGRGEDFDQPAG